LPTIHDDAIRKLDLIIDGEDPANDTSEIKPSAA